MVVWDAQQLFSNLLESAVLVDVLADLVENTVLIVVGENAVLHVVIA